MKKKLTVLLFIFAMFAAGLRAEVVMPKIFGDNMVVQSGKSVKVWGKSSPNADIEVLYAGKKAKTKASDKGEWSLYMPILIASKEPSDFKVLENGKTAKTFSNVLTGEVWLAGGQSNMEFTIGASTDFESFKKRMNADPQKYSLIRFIKPKKSNMSKTKLFDFDCDAKWSDIVSNPEFRFSSAVAFYFAEKLVDSLDIPVGLIITPLGGSSMVAWVPEEFLKGEPTFEKELKSFKEKLATYNYNKALDTFKKRNAEYEESVKAAKAQGKPEPKKPYDLQPVWTPNPLSPNNIRSTPAWLYNAKIAPIAGYTIRGVIWYQGEANLTWRLDGTFTSRFNRLMEAWRAEWKDVNMPFIFAQLPSFGKQRSWPETRWQQFESFKQTPNSHIVITIDTGEENDIHPKQKTPVADRFARIALNKFYGKNITAYGPMPVSAKFESNSATVKLDCKSDLKCSGSPRGFEVRSGGKWISAKAKISPEGFVRISSPDGSKIDAVRYAWLDWAVPQVCLFDSENLPAAPFVFFKDENTSKK